MAHKLTWLGDSRDQEGEISRARLAHCTFGFRLTPMAAPNWSTPTAKFLGAGDSVRASPLESCSSNKSAIVNSFCLHN